MILRILLLTLFLSKIAWLNAQGIDYVHPNKASFQHSLICTVFKVVGLKKGKTNSGPDNFYTRKKPLKKLYRKHIIEKIKVDDRDVYILAPRKVKSGFTVIYLHGGAYTANFMKQHWLFISKLVRKKAVKVIAPDYPLAPDFNWRHNLSFVLKCYRKALESTPADSIILMGDSAGGGLALALAMAARDEGLAQPHQIIMLAPWLDLQMGNPEIAKLEKNDPMLNLKIIHKAAMSYALDNASMTNPYVSPINGNLLELAPMSIFIGGRDVLKADTKKFKAMCEVQGIETDYFYYPKMMHVWMLAAFLPESKKAFSQIGNLIDSKTKSSVYEKR